MRRIFMSFALVVIASAALFSQTRGGAVAYEGARLLTGDTTAPIDNGVFVVQNGRFIGVGRRGAVRIPGGASLVDLTGKTVMPGMINVHVHIGYDAYTSWGAEDYTPENIVDHLQREAFYGVVATQTVGSSPT